MRKGTIDEIRSEGRFTHCLICGKRLDKKGRSDRNVCGTSCRVHKHTAFKTYESNFKLVTEVKGYPPEKAYEKMIEVDIKLEQPIRVLQLWWEQRKKKLVKLC